jgi:hypothetical protein
MILPPLWAVPLAQLAVLTLAVGGMIVFLYRGLP